MKESDPLYIELSHYFEMGKFNTITSQKEKEHVLENLRVGIFELLDKNLQAFNEDIFDFVFEGLSKLGLEFDDLLPTPHSINKKILDTLFSLTLKDIYCETRYYLVDIIKKICRMLEDFKGN